MCYVTVTLNDLSRAVTTRSLSQRSAIAKNGYRLWL